MDNLRPISHDKIIDKVNTWLQPQCFKKEISLQINGKDDGLMILVDADRIQQLLYTLLSHAVEHASVGQSISVTYQYALGGEESVWVIYMIEPMEEDSKMQHMEKLAEEQGGNLEFDVEGNASRAILQMQYKLQNMDK